MIPTLDFDAGASSVGGCVPSSMGTCCKSIEGMF